MQVSCPLLSVDLPGVPDVDLHGLIVVVGSNSSGKTQFLHDLNETVCGRRRQLVVATAVSFRPPPPFSEYFDYFVEQGVISESSPDQFLKRSLQFGADEGAGSFHKSTIQSQYQQFATVSQKKAEGCIPDCGHLKELGALSCSVLFLKNRLTLMDACGTFDWLKDGPSKTLQSLYLNKNAKVALYNEISQVFQRSVWVDNTRHAKLVLRVSDSTTLPPADDRLEPEIMEKYRTIETEGDGLRSYSAICTTLLLEQRPLCLIDEPEMCLHPPQAHAMGRFIGTHASDKNCTVVASHSSHVLRGILETNPEAHVIRLSRAGSAFHARNLSSDLLEQATSKPRSRSETILEGLLSHCVVLCEAEGDRIVYESTYRTFKNRRLDIRFIPSEGTGGFVDPLRLYNSLSVPTAVVADLDFLAKEGELKKVLTGLGAPENETQELSASAREAISLIKSCVSHINFSSIKDELKELAQAPIDLTTNGDSRVRSKLLNIAARLYSLRDLQEGGIAAVPQEYDDGAGKVFVRQKVQTLVNKLRDQGLFLVPVGELESWVSVLMKGHSREDKSRWAMLAAEKIEDVGERDEDVWNFIRTVYEFLENRLALIPKSPTRFVHTS